MVAPVETAYVRIWGQVVGAVADDMRKKRAYGQ